MRPTAKGASEVRDRGGAPHPNREFGQSGAARASQMGGFARRAAWIISDRPAGYSDDCVRRATAHYLGRPAGAGERATCSGGAAILRHPGSDGWAAQAFPITRSSYAPICSLFRQVARRGQPHRTARSDVIALFVASRRRETHGGSGWSRPNRAIRTPLRETIRPRTPWRPPAILYALCWFPAESATLSA